jgi:hypothetical protein
MIRIWFYESIIAFEKTTVNYDIITSQVRLLYTSGGIDARAIFSAKGRKR